MTKNKNHFCIRYFPGDLLIHFQHYYYYYLLMDSVKLCEIYAQQI